MADKILNYEKLDIETVEEELNAEFLSLKPGYDAAKSNREDWWKQYRFQL